MILKKSTNNCDKIFNRGYGQYSIGDDSIRVIHERTTNSEYILKISDIGQNTKKHIIREYKNYKRLQQLNLDFIHKEYYLLRNKINDTYGLMTKFLGVIIDRIYDHDKPSKKIPDFKGILEKHGYLKLNLTESNIVYNEKLDKYFLVDLVDILTIKNARRILKIEKKKLSQKKKNNVNS